MIRMTSADLDLVNRLVLGKQHLAEDSKIDDVVRIANDVSGLHATSATTPYLSLLARTRSFTRASLEEQLFTKKRLGKIRCMRSTIYILPRELIPIAFSATRRLSELTSGRYAELVGVTENEYKTMSERVAGLLQGKSLTTAEVKQALGVETNTSAVLNLMCDQGLLIRAAPRAGWRSNAHTYQLFREYFPDMDLDAFSENDARRLLVERHLRSFGPATERDVAWWIGIPKGEVRNALDALGETVGALRITGIDGIHVAPRRDVEHLAREMGRREAEAEAAPGRKGPPTTERPVVNLLPSLDPYLMSYKDRHRYLDDDHREYVFDRSGNATATILLNGRVIGVWDFADGKEPVVKLCLFKAVGRAVLDEINSQGRAAGRFIAEREVELRQCESMVPLTERTAGAVMSPLKGL